MAVKTTFGQNERDRDDAAPPRSIVIFGRRLPLPRSRALRICIGILLMVGGILGFLPILGLWMFPLGLLVLSYEFAGVRRLRRRMVVWWARRREARRRRHPPLKG